MTFTLLRRVAKVLFVLDTVLILYSLVGLWFVLSGRFAVPQMNLPLATTILASLSIGLAFFGSLFHAIATQGTKVALRIVVAACSLSLGMELLGTMTGLPFGRYSYTGLLGPKILGHVPVVLPLSWFAVYYPALLLAVRITGNRTGTALCAALVLTLWDVPMDPASTTGFASWVWHQTGPYYGMPLTNWMGWILTGWMIGVAVRWKRIGGTSALNTEDVMIPLGIYFIQGLQPAVMAILVNRPGAALLWCVGMAVVGFLALRKHPALVPYLGG
ncbi:MAG TPA: carotenoid biosynthesis protein [Pseudomonadota bacterium]|nr:carotenoid biosynthesis protein [Pseudomonadota bacterium]